MFGFEKQNLKSDQDAVQKELERAQAEKLRVIAEPDSPQKEGMLRALNDIIANLQEQIGTGLENATEPTIEEPSEDLSIPAATDFITRMQTKLDRNETLSPEEEEELSTFTLTVAEAQKIKPDSQNLRVALTLLSDIRTKNETQRNQPDA